MAKKLILLVLLVPIIVMACLFAATRSVSNLIDVPVTGIEIIDTEAHIYLNLDEGETYKLSYAVYPTTAKNKSVTPSAEAVEGQAFPTLDFAVEDGSVTVTPKSAGVAKVYLTSADGGFKDSVIIHVESTALKSLDASVAKDTLAVGETVGIQTDFNPTAPSNTVCHYASGNPRIATVDDNGRIRAVGKGTTDITVTSLYNPDIFDVLTINVYNLDVMDLGMTEIVTQSRHGSIPISIDTESAFDLTNFTFTLLDGNGDPLPEGAISAEITEENGAYALDYTFNDDTFVGEITVEITYRDALDTVTKSCSISRVSDITLSFDAEGGVSLYTGQQIQVPYLLTPTDASVSYRVSVSNGNVSAMMVGTRLILTADKAGVATLTLTVTSKEIEGMEKTAKVLVAILPSGFSINESAATFGIEDLFTVGGYEYDSSATGMLIPSENGSRKHSLTYSIKGDVGEGFRENVSWITDTPAVQVDRNGTLKILDHTFQGTVSVYARFSPYPGVFARTESFSLRVVADAVNVYSYRDLYYATESGHAVVLHTDIKEDFGYIDGVVKYSELHTTYDDTYYQNTGAADEAKVKVLIRFRNDVYGNGYTVSAHNVAYSLDASGMLSQNALFRGPLSFVAMLETASSISIGAQDNICFAVYENVDITNVTLEGCELSPDEDGKLDLVDLEYTGTTVEVLGDNVSIRYSRLLNGRTVLRAFGDSEDPKKVIHLNVSNTVFNGAREFLLRIGSNCFVDGTYENYSPKLPGDNRESYTAKERYQEMSDEERAAYDEKFIKTFVTVKNCVFKDAGLFAIGVDSHFSGVALADGGRMLEDFPALKSMFQKADGTTLIDAWKNLAKTSYGAKLTFEGEVNLYNWKDIRDVDSSSLIDVPENSAFSGKIDFDVQEMLTSLSKQSGYSDIIHNEEGVTYVHAGIAFFGGGKNYGVFDDGDENPYTLSRYKVSLGTVDKAYFVYAAGEESFYFFMYNTSSGFNYADQMARLAEGGDGYDCIYRK